MCSWWLQFYTSLTLLSFSVKGSADSAQVPIATAGLPWVCYSNPFVDINDEVQSKHRFLTKVLERNSQRDTIWIHDIKIMKHLSTALMDENKWFPHCQLHLKVKWFRQSDSIVNWCTTCLLIWLLVFLVLSDFIVALWSQIMTDTKKKGWWHKSRCHLGLALMSPTVIYYLIKMLQLCQRDPAGLYMLKQINCSDSGQRQQGGTGWVCESVIHRLTQSMDLLYVRTDSHRQ